MLISNYDKRKMSNENLKSRTKQFALRVINLVESLPHDMTSSILGWQLLRAGTSVGANYRAACRSKSNADFISKMGTVEEEADESCYWMELLVESGKIKSVKVSNLMREGSELTAIAVSSLNTARKSAKRRCLLSFCIPHSAFRTPFINRRSRSAVGAMGCVELCSAMRANGVSEKGVKRFAAISTTPKFTQRRRTLA